MLGLNRVRRVTFKEVCGSVCLLAGLLFIYVDASFMAQGAARYAVEWKEKIQLGAVAACIPIILAIMPFLFVLTWKRGKRFGRPTAWTGVIAVVWGLFATYAVMGAGGSISHVRSDVISARKFDASRDRDTGKRRAKLAAELDAIPASTRPAAEIEGLMAAERAKPSWERSEACQDPSRRRAFCTAYAKLVAELGAAKRRDELDAQIAGIDDRKEVAGWVAEVVDPTARFWAKITGFSEPDVQDWIPIATPLVLLIGSWTFLGFSLILFGYAGHRDALLAGTSSAALGGQPLPATGLPAAAGTQAPTHQVSAAPPASVTAWLAAHVRPVSKGQGIGEEQWYAYYSRDCALSNVVPVPLQVFRGAAQKAGAVVTVIDDKVLYERVLPLVPEVGAA